jgi:hypothetical protein
VLKFENSGECLSQTGFLTWDIAPFLDNGLLDRSWVGSGSGADLLGNINTLFCGLKFGNQFGDVLAGSLWLQSTLFHGSILDNGLDLIMALFVALGRIKVR